MSLRGGLIHAGTQIEDLENNWWMQELLDLGLVLEELDNWIFDAATELVTVDHLDYSTNPPVILNTYTVNRYQPGT